MECRKDNGERYIEQQQGVSEEAERGKDEGTACSGKHDTE